VAILEGKDLQNRVREDVGDAHDDPRPPAIIEPVRFDLALEVVPRDELRTAHVECGETRPHALLGPKDLPCIDLVGLAEKLQDDCDTVHVPLPSE